MKTKRLDVLLFERGLAKSREQAQALILAGEVWTKERRLEKPGMQIDTDLEIEVRSRSLPFVSRAGQKISHALETFKVDVAGRVCMDIGASTGGFTDCLLQKGAKHVFSVDVGYGQLDAKLRQHPQVTSVERTNARYLTREKLRELSPLADEVGFICADVSFISLSKVIPPLSEEFPMARDWVLLFKPQFEVGREHIGKGGLVRSEEATRAALEAFQQDMIAKGFESLTAPESSPLWGKKSGNLEYLIYYVLPQKRAK